MIIFYILLLSQFNFDAFFVIVPLLLSSRDLGFTLYKLKLTSDYNNIGIATYLDISLS